MSDQQQQKLDTDTNGAINLCHRLRAWLEAETPVCEDDTTRCAIQLSALVFALTHHIAETTHSEAHLELGVTGVCGAIDLGAHAFYLERRAREQ